MAANSIATTRFDRETITSGVHRIGFVAAHPKGGFIALDDDGRQIEVFETRPAARRAVYENFRGEDACR